MIIINLIIIIVWLFIGLLFAISMEDIRREDDNPPLKIGMKIICITLGPVFILIAIIIKLLERIYLLL